MNKKNRARVRISYAPDENYGWGHRAWMQDLISYIKTQFDVQLNLIDRIPGSIPFETVSYKEGIHDNIDYIRDTEIVIENLDTYEIVVLSYSESIHDIINFLRNPYLKHFYFVHHYWKILDCWELRTELKDRLHLLKPFFGLDLYNADNHRNYDRHRIKYSPDSCQTDKMFCKARGVRGEHAFRRVLAILEDEHADKINNLTPVSYGEYLEQAKKSKIGLSYSCDFDCYYIDLCHRDMEYAMIGLPFIRIEFQNRFIEPLIPDFHYISIPYKKATQAFKDSGNAAVATLIADKYDEVINDNEFLKYISRNISDWFDRNIQPKRSVKKMFELSMSEWKL